MPYVFNPFTSNFDYSISAQPTSVTVSGTSKTLAISDANTIQDCSNASGQNITIPPNSSVAFPVGTVILFLQSGAGTVTAIGGSGVTVNGISSTTAQYSTFAVKKEATNTWEGIGTVQSVTLTGDVTGSGSATVATTITNSVVTNAKLANMASNTVKGNVTGGAAAPTDLTATQLTTLVNPFTSTLSGAATASGGGTTAFLRADNTWAVPAGTGTVTTTGSPASGNLTKFSGATTIVNGDLSGDITTSGTLATTVAKIQTVTVSGVTGTGNVVFSASPTVTGTLTATTLTMSGVLTNSVNSALSTPSVNISGTVITGGTATTTTPLILISPTGTAAVASWSTSGTVIGINSGSAPGNFIDFHNAGATSVFKVDGSGIVTAANAVNANGGTSAINQIQLTAGNQLIWASRTRLSCPSDGINLFQNNASNGYTGIKLGGTTSSFPYIKVNGAAINFRLADDSADAGITASTAAFSGKITTYNNVATAGWGVAAIQASTNITAQTSNATITSYANPAADGDYEVSAQINVTAATVISTSINVTYTDANNNAQTMIMPLVAQAGSFISGGLVIATGTYESPVIHIRVKASTTITILTAAGTFTSVTYSASGKIQQTA